MDIIGTITCYIVLLCIIYLIIDHLIRIPRIGNYKNRYIFITGCDTGFGNVAAKRLDKLGCNVFAGCLTETGEMELRKVCSERLHTISLDVTKRESVRKAFEYVRSKLPDGTGLWGLVNNAGVLSCFGPTDWHSVDDYKQQCDVNLWGLIDVTLTFLPLVKMARGRIVNTSSVGGRITWGKWTPYCISKYGVESFTDGLRRDLYSFGCMASAIEPGGYATHIVNPQGLQKTIAKSWEKTPKEIQEEYGEEYYKYVSEPLIKALRRDFSLNLGEVVDAYEHALFGVFPRARYVVGRDAKYIFLPIQALPEWLADWILRRFDSGQPRPIAISKQF